MEDKECFNNIHGITKRQENHNNDKFPSYKKELIITNYGKMKKKSQDLKTKQTQSFV